MSEEDSRRSVRNANLRTVNNKQYEDNYDRIFGKDKKDVNLDKKESNNG